jgi:DNA-binding MarR family transcriptional regulator
MSRSRASARASTATVDAVLGASKALVGVAARTVASLGQDELTLPQFRALLLVAEGRATAPGDLAGTLDVHPSNATRLVDRLVAKGLLDRAETEGDRRSIALTVTPAGSALLDRVYERRRRDLAEILGRMSAADAAAMADALGRFGELAGEVGDVPADDAWRLGWGS